MFQIGVIGYGSRMKTFLNALMKTEKVRVAAIADINLDAAKAQAQANGLEGITYYTDAKEMLDIEKLDGVLVGTRCPKHREMAELVASYDLPLFLEKPVCILEEDLPRLEALLPAMEQRTVVSFPLRASVMFRRVKELLDQGVIGEVAHVQAYNNVPYARGYYHKWYRDDSQTGGLFLQKATHDLDYIHHLLGDDRPVRICAASSKQVFRGNEPAGKKCADCEKAATCLEGPQNLLKENPNAKLGEYCCFAVDTGNEDSGSCIVEYESGLHVVYSQNFIVRHGAGKRGARLVGFLGTLEFDWLTGIITLHHHFENKVETFDMNDAQVGSHFGGDQVLANGFVDVMMGKESIAPLSSGILSARLCLAARRSAQDHTFVSLE